MVLLNKFVHCFNGRVVLGTGVVQLSGFDLHFIVKQLGFSTDRTRKIRQFFRLLFVLVRRTITDSNTLFLKKVSMVCYLLADLLENCQPKVHSRWMKFMTRAQSVADNNTRSSNLPARFSLLFRFSYALYWEDKFRVATEFMQEAESIGRNLFDESHTELMSARSFLADLLQTTGQISDAKKMLRRNLRISREAGGEEDPQTLRCAADYGFLIRKSEPAEAERILQKTLEHQRHVLGEEHEDTVLTKESLVTCLQTLSRHREAEEIAREVLHTQLNELGEEELRTTETMLNLSRTLIPQGLFEEAENLARRSYLTRLRTMGTKSNLTCSSLAVLVDVLVDAGRYQQAEEEIRSMLKLQESMPGEELPAKLNSMLTLGYCLIKMAKYRDAVSLWREAKERCTRCYGEAHRNTILCAELLRSAEERLS